MVNLLQGYCNKHPKLWDEKIHYVHRAYNMALHSSTQSSLLETCFGNLPKDPLDFVFGKDEDSNEKSDENKACNFFQRIQIIHQEVQAHLEKSQV